MIQAQKHQNWSKSHLKLQKEPNISMMCTRRNLFLKFENTKNGRKAPNQAIKIFFLSISSKFAIFDELLLGSYMKEFLKRAEKQ
jgi:hypothetical protein